MFLSGFFCCAFFWFRWRYNNNTVFEYFVEDWRSGERKWRMAAVFGAIGGMMAVLCLNALWRVEQADDGGIEDQYEESQKQAQEHDERLP